MVLESVWRIIGPLGIALAIVAGLWFVAHFSAGFVEALHRHRRRRRR